MAKFGTLIVLLLALPCLAGPKANDKKLVPPIASHSLVITSYGCDKHEVLDTTAVSKETSLWTLLVWAEYGDKHKRYWQQTYGTYKVPLKQSIGSSGESVASGAPIGGYENPSYDFTAMDKVCGDWALEVRSALKMEPNGAAAKQ